MQLTLVFAIKGSVRIISSNYASVFADKNWTKGYTYHPLSRLTQILHAKIWIEFKEAIGHNIVIYN